MAYVNQTRSAAANLADHIVELYADFRAARAQARLYRTTYRELSALSARDLDDLGVNRSMIRSIAREAAYGK